MRIIEMVVGNCYYCPHFKWIDQGNLRVPRCFHPRMLLDHKGGAPLDNAPVIPELCPIPEPWDMDARRNALGDIPPVVDSRTVKVLFDIEAERLHQEALWHGEQHDLVEWMMILGEEYGEACKEMHPRVDLKRFRAEIIQVAAVATAIAEFTDLLIEVERSAEKEKSQ